MQDDPPPTDAPNPAAPEPMSVYAYVVDLTNDAGDTTAVVPCMTMQTPQGLQSLPMVAFGQKQGEALRPQAQHIANSIGKPLRILQGQATEVSRLEPQLVTMAADAPGLIR